MPRMIAPSTPTAMPAIAPELSPELCDAFDPPLCDELLELTEALDWTTAAREEAQNDETALSVD